MQKKIFELMFPNAPVLLCWMFLVSFLLMYDSFGYVGSIKYHESVEDGQFVEVKWTGVRTVSIRLGLVKNGKYFLAGLSRSVNREYMPLQDSVKKLHPGDSVVVRRFCSNYGGCSLISVIANSQVNIFSRSKKDAAREVVGRSEYRFKVRIFASLFFPSFLIFECIFVALKLRQGALQQE